MSSDLQPYPEYKDSDIPWSGEIPAHWTYASIRRYCRVFAGATPSRAVPSYWTNGTIPWLSSGDVNLRRIYRASQFITEAGFAASSTKWIKPKSLVIALAGQGRTKGMVATVEFWTTCNQSLAAIEPSPQIADHRFVAYFLESRYQSIRGLVGNGLRDGLNLEHVKSFPTPLPPRDEQDAIVRFLDHADRRIRRYIRAKRRLIALLNEQKQVIIQNAVTRGLDPTVPMKDSGVEWLGEIPDNYFRAKLGRVCLSIRDGTHNPPPALSGIHRLLSVRNIVDGRFITRNDDRTMSPAAYAELQRSYTVQEGDVVLALVGATTGKSAVVEAMENVSVQRSIGILRPNPQLIDSHFLNFVIRSCVIQEQIQQIMNKYAAQPGIYLADVAALQVIFPDLPTQRAVVRTLQKQLLALDEATALIKHEIELMHECRARLIADIVTGKLDVREAAWHLPDDEGDEPDEYDDEEQLTEDEDLDESAGGDEYAD